MDVHQELKAKIAEKERKIHQAESEVFSDHQESCLRLDDMTTHVIVSYMEL